MIDWNALVEEHGPLVVGISWRILGNAADVEDNVQEVFFSAWRQAGHAGGPAWQLAVVTVSTEICNNSRNTHFGSDNPSRVLRCRVQRLGLRKLFCTDSSLARRGR